MREPGPFRDAVVAWLVAAGKTAIPDDNDDHEIRVRSGADAAENDRILVLGGDSAWNYTSTCTPAGF